jgi:hypothetical protein
MKLSVDLKVLCVLVMLVAGCSSSDSDEDRGMEIDPFDNTGGAAAALLGIASADSNSQPAVLEIESLLSALDTISSDEPVSVEEGDSADGLLRKAGL